MSLGSKIFLFPLKLFLVTLIAVLVLASAFELYLRHSGFLSAVPANYPCVIGDPVLNHKFRPDCEEIGKAQNLKTEKDVTYKTNSMGVRGPLPLADKKKLLLIGDSYTEGFGLEESETFPAQLQKFSDQAGLKGWQFLNGGTMGYSPALYTNYYKMVWSKVPVDVVFLNLDLSDINDDIYFFETGEFDESGRITSFPARELFPQWILPAVYGNRSALLRFVHQEVNSWHHIQLREKNHQKMDELLHKGTAALEGAWLVEANLQGCKKPLELVFRNILQLKAAIPAKQFFLHVYPPGQFVKSYAQQPQGMSPIRSWDQSHRADTSWFCGIDQRIALVAKKFAEKNHLEFLESFSFVEKHPEKKKMYFDGDAHWNAYGVSEITSNLAPVLSTKLGKVK